MPLFVKRGLPLGYGHIIHLGGVVTEGPGEGVAKVVGGALDVTG